MKIAFFNSTRRSLERPAGGSRRWGAFLALGVVFAAASGSAVGTVDTLGGGPRQGNPANFGYTDGDTLNASQFSTPSGLALDSTGNYLFVADRDNNAIRRLNLGGNLTETFVAAAQGIARPVAVAMDSADNLYVVNQGNGANGTVLKFDRFKNLVATLATGLNNASAVALDGSGNVYVTVQGNTVRRISGGTSTVVGTVTAAGASLAGMAVLDSGLVALSDVARHGIYLLNPDTGVITTNAGFRGAGDNFGPPEFAKFNQPSQIAKAGDGMLVVADRGNHRVKVVDSAGTVLHFYGIPAADWAPGWPWPGWYDGAACDNGFGACAEAREPLGLVVAADGTVYSTEVYYHLIRKTTGSGLAGPGTGGGGGGGGGGSGTNVVVTAPTISPNSGYFPMGQVITVGSPNPNVFYTTDGTVPTTNSLRVAMNGNSGTIRWNNSMKDLTSLRVRAFVGTNASAVVSGLASSANSIGVPAGLNGQILAGVGSTISFPVVVNLRPVDRVQSLQFRVEVTPDETHANNISDQFRALSILTNDFVRVVTAAQGATTAVYSATSYALSAGGGRTNRGLAISAIGTNSGVMFSNYAVVAMLAVPIPKTAREGQTYSVTVLNASATSDGMQTPVSLPSMPAATILVTNVPYLVGDSSPGTWYDAGSFGNGDLDNADVNNAFYAALGLRVPHAFSDAYDAMDAYPADRAGFVGGDGLIRFLDWQLILQRSLRLNTNNWKRLWNTNGVRVNSGGPVALPKTPGKPVSSLDLVAGSWHRNALIGALPVSHVAANSWVDVPVYAKVAAGSTVAGLQFRLSITPEGAAPALAQPLQFIAAEGFNAPGYQVPLTSEIGCAWALPLDGQAGTLLLPSQSSNLLGFVRFRVPDTASSGQSYAVHFTFVDGAPNTTTEYSFETRSAQVRVGAAAAPGSITSDEWQIAYFGEVGTLEGADTADADRDGVPNWQEFLAGTDPRDPASKLQFRESRVQTSGGSKQVVLRWQTVPGRVYEIREAASPNAAVWNWRASFTGDGAEAAFVETNAGGAARFYRLRIQP